MRLFVDMDGTLAKWNEVQYEEQLLEKGYYRNLLPNQKVVDEVNSIIAKGYDVYVLSCVLPESQYAKNEKVEWLKEYLPQLKTEKQIFVPYGRNKAEYLKENYSPITNQDYLLDDYTKNLIEWKEYGGIGIKYFNGINHTHATWKGVIVADNVNIDTPYKKISSLNLIISEYSLVDKALKLIDTYIKKEFEEKNYYNDLSHIGLAYTETEDGKHTIEVFCNLEKYKIIQLFDGVQVAERAYDSLSKLIDNELYSLSFDDLVYLYDEEGFIEKVNMVRRAKNQKKLITNQNMKCKEKNMDREYDYVTFLIKHKELFTFDKEQKIFYDKNYELAIGKKAELIEALRKFGKDIFEKEDEAEFSKYRNNEYIVADLNNGMGMQLLSFEEFLNKYRYKEMYGKERQLRQDDKFIAGSIESGYDNYLSVEEAADEVEKEEIEY